MFHHSLSPKPRRAPQNGYSHLGGAKVAPLSVSRHHARKSTHLNKAQAQNHSSPNRQIFSCCYQLVKERRPTLAIRRRAVDLDSKTREHAILFTIKRIIFSLDSPRLRPAEFLRPTYGFAQISRVAQKVERLHKKGYVTRHSCPFGDDIYFVWKGN
jgi:hypothetical protein